MANKIKVLLVDDHPLVRDGLVNLINREPDLEVCGEAGSEPQALERLATVTPDVAVVDISLETGSGLELVKSIKAVHPGVKSLVLSMHDESLYAERALHAGMTGNRRLVRPPGPYGLTHACGCGSTRQIGRAHV